MSKIKDGITVLHILAMNNRKELIQMLLTDPNLDVTLKNNNGETAYDLTTDDDIKDLLQARTPTSEPTDEPFTD